MGTLTKRQAAALFGGRFTDLAAAVRITKGAISQWPQQLTQEQHDRVVGAALRLGRLSLADVARLSGGGGGEEDAA